MKELAVTGCSMCPLATLDKECEYMTMNRKDDLTYGIEPFLFQNTPLHPDWCPLKKESLHITIK